MFVKKKNKSYQHVRYFNNPILDKLSHTSLSTVILIYTPIVLYFLSKSFTHFNVFIILLAMILGLFIWSFTEYCTHRFAFHFKVKNSRLKYLHAIFHLAHHEQLQDSSKYQALIILTLPISVLYYYLFKFLFAALSAPIFAGFILGYIIYEIVHFSTHQFKMQSKITKSLKQHHMRHHYFNDTKNFGVTSPLWDYVFHTHLNANEMRESYQNKMNG